LIDPFNTYIFRKRVNLGEEYQAILPEFREKYVPDVDARSEDTLLWKPSHLTDQEVEGFLTDIRKASKDEVDTLRSQLRSHSESRTGIITDDEEALLLLLNCRYDREEAIMRWKVFSKGPRVQDQHSMESWSEEELTQFEEGFKKHYKDFFMIHKEFLFSKSVSQIVSFYYKWKKTERHHDFIRSNIIEKRRRLHASDLIERYVEENDDEVEWTSSVTLPPTFDHYEGNSPVHHMNAHFIKSSSYGEGHSSEASSSVTTSDGSLILREDIGEKSQVPSFVIVNETSATNLGNPSLDSPSNNEKRNDIFSFHQDHVSG
jgi:hypothetical protein